MYSFSSSLIPKDLGFRPMILSLLDALCSRVYSQCFRVYDVYSLCFGVCYILPMHSSLLYTLYALE